MGSGQCKVVVAIARFWEYLSPRQGDVIKKIFDQVLEDLISPLRPPAPLYPPRQKVQVGLSDPQTPTFPGISAGFPATFCPT